MIAVVLTLPLILLTVAAAILVPWLVIRFELMHRTQGRLAEELESQRKLAKQLEATIEAYRQLVASDANFALAPSAPRPSGWQKLASATRGS